MLIINIKEILQRVNKGLKNTKEWISVSINNNEKYDILRSKHE